MFGSIRKFAKDRKGAFAMQFALMAIPLTVCTGLAIDGGRAFLARFELASALDAAALAVGSTFDSGADLDAIALKFVNANFRTEHDGPIEVQVVADDNNVTVKGSVTINTYFMPLVGQPHVEISAESEVRRGGSNIEVALALDVTGSMDGTRIAGLKEAAQILVDEVVNVQQTPYFSKIAIIPWSAQVYTGTKNTDLSVIPELRGTPKGAEGVSAATWHKSGTTSKAISTAGWRTAATAGGIKVSGVTWKNGSSYSVSTTNGIVKTDSSKAVKTDSSATRIRVQVSSNPGYANGDTVYITGANGSYTGLNNTAFKVADVTTSSPYYFWLQNVGTTTYTTPPSGSTVGTAGTLQRCYDQCQTVLVTTSSNHTLSANDFAHVTGVGGITSINNGNTETWVVGSVPSTTTYFVTLGASVAGQTFSGSSGRSSECYTSDCRYQITTTSAHGLSTSDYVAIFGMTEGSGTTSAMKSVNYTWSSNTSKIVDPAGSIFYLPGDGVNYKDWTSGGSVGACELSTCNVNVTTPTTGLSVGEYIRIDGATGMTGLNSCSIRTSSGSCTSGSTAPVAWPIQAINGNVLTLSDTGPVLTNMGVDYASGGAAQCTNYGCAKLLFVSSSNRIYQPTNCIVERYGDDAATDTATSTSPLGMNYSSDGACDTSNYVTPLTSKVDRLTTSISDLQVGGSTAGQIGIGWAWYMLSPNFKTVWDKEDENAPKDYTEPELAKIAILMTDGEFNFSTCKGVSESSWSSGVCSVSKTPFEQAEAICTAMKTQGITIYTVGLELDTSQYSDDFLLKCASTSKHAFLAGNIDELKAAFSKIAISISKLRIAK